MNSEVDPHVRANLDLVKQTLHTVSADVGVLKGRVDDFAAWQQRQNGSLAKIEAELAVMRDELGELRTYLSDIQTKIIILLVGVILSAVGGVIALFWQHLVGPP